MSEPLPLQIEALKAAALNATPGPWVYFPKPKYNEHHVSLPIEGSGMRRALFDDGCKTDRAEADAKFIAAANPAIVLSLIAEIKALREQNAALRKAQEWQPIEAAPFLVDLLVADQHDYVGRGYRSKTYKNLWTHWQPLPAAPHQVNQENPQ